MKYNVTLDGISLAHATEAAPVRIMDVIELQPARTTTMQERLGAPGSALLRDHLNSRQVRVQFAILTDNYQKRTAALSDITAWAMSGRLLQLADRPDQQLRVLCMDPPLTMSKRKWTDLCEVTFTAYDVPFWEDAFPVCVYSSGVTDAELVIFPTGNVRQVPLCFSVTPTSSPLTKLSITVNGAEMAFSGLAVPSGKTLGIAYEEGVLTAKWTNDEGLAVPCLRWRSGAEYLPINTRQNNSVHITADTACDVTLSARGWYW